MYLVVVVVVVVVVSLAPLVVLREYLNQERDKLRELCRKVNNKELHNFYSSLDIVRITKRRRVRWMGRAERFFGDGKLLQNYSHES